jgi:hypothetical protein
MGSLCARPEQPTCRTHPFLAQKVIAIVNAFHTTELVTEAMFTDVITDSGARLAGQGSYDPADRRVWGPARYEVHLDRIAPSAGLLLRRRSNQMYKALGWDVRELAGGGCGCAVEEAEGPEEIGTRGIYSREIIIVSYKFPE